MPAGLQRVLITGASGFVGACLARDQAALGQDVHVFVRPGTNLWRLAGQEGRITTHWGDLRDPQAVRKAVHASRPDVVYHLAAHGAFHSQKDRAAILASNLLGTANLLDALEGHDYRVLVHTGSSSEYGHKTRPMREDDLLEPRTDYGVAKAAATLLCQAEAYKGRPVANVRIFTAYGPWDDPSRLIPYVMGCCLRGEAPRVSWGQQPRDFIHIDDVLSLLKMTADNPQARGRIVHAGTGQQHSVSEVVNTILSLCGGGGLQPEFGAEPIRPGEPSHWVASIEQTTALTGWRPRHDLCSGIELTWRWFRAAHSLKAA